MTITMDALEGLLAAKDHTHPPLTKQQITDYKLVLAYDSDGEEHYLFSGSDSDSNNYSSEADNTDNDPIMLS